MTFPLHIDDGLRRAIKPGASVMLGISGGLDSAMSLAVLRELGCEVIAVTFENAADSITALDDARTLARRFGAEHQICDVTEPFEELVIRPFVEEYRAARTPNPCLFCNCAVRFPGLLRLARHRGCELVATGHYARTLTDTHGRTWLHRGVDPAKDQSYFLSWVPASTWPQVVFPLGWSLKTEVREAARTLGLTVAEKSESQEICFVPDGDRTCLIGDQGMGRSGPIVDRSGTVMGEHRGLGRYTVGQRRGLGVPHSEPLYVLALEPDTNRLVVGPRSETMARHLRCDRYDVHDPSFPDRGRGGRTGMISAQIRHRHAGARVATWSRRDDHLDVDLAESVAGAAPGQGVTLYEGDRVVARGRLLSAD